MNSLFELEIEKMKNSFSLTKVEMLNIANGIMKDMQNKQYLRMLPSKLKADKSPSEGKYIALDFGGSNVRICVYHLKGNGKYETISETRFALNDGQHNYLSGNYKLLDIFMEIARHIKTIIEPNEHCYLGHSFSGAFVSKDINHAITTKFSSAFNVKDVNGYDINETLNMALKKYNLNVEPVSVINDTTSVLVGAKYLYPNVDMSCIVGTGYNMGMIDKNHEIINTESGAYSDFDLGYYDEKYVQWRGLNKNESSLMYVFVAPGPKAAIMAKLVMDDFVTKGILVPIDNITPEMLSFALKGDIDGGLSENQKVFIKEVAKAIYSRGAKLIACQIYAILALTDPDLKHEHGIMFEGSTARNVPYLDYVKDALSMLYGEKASKIDCYFEKDVAMLGAAVSASMVSKGLN